MTMSDSRPNSALADLSRIDSYHAKPEDSTSGVAAAGEMLLQVVIETPRGSRNKYSFDPEQRVMRLKSLLPAGMVFPFDFGFVPSTRGGDGDPLDVLVLMEEPAFPACALLVRPLGAMLIEQTVRGKKERNDRVVAVADSSQVFANLETINDLPRPLRAEVEEFFHQYHRLQGKESQTLTWQGVEGANLLIEEARRAWNSA
jgi:inorganic pyrophosphatase